MASIADKLRKLAELEQKLSQTYADGGFMHAAQVHAQMAEEYLRQASEED